jgi:hypothetical protein
MKWWPDYVDDCLSLYVKQLAPWFTGFKATTRWNGGFTKFKW